MTAEPVREIERELLVLIRRVRRTSVENARRVHPELPPAAYPVLLYVADHGPTRASDVVDHLGTDKGAVSRQVAQLEQLGLVTRSCDPEDRRAQALVLTADGRARLDRLAAERRSEFARRLAAWSPEDLASFADQLSRYNATLES